jgi:ubiquinone/menaquinone biosynthesis C-methylase UbiE
MINDNNQKTYTSPSVVEHYAQLITLQPAEATILKLLQTQLGSMKMLDIGVGGGRTTQHFSEVVAEYTGIDYSINMIAACQKRFSEASDTTLFQVCDARDMSQFKDNSFDFILFSFNGIDYISHAERLQVFEEIQRIGKLGGYFYFSSHNLTGFEQEFDFKQQFSFNLLKTYIDLVMSALLHVFNFPTTFKQLNNSAYSILKDESHNFRLKTYYIRPQEQIDQLESHFSNVKVYSWKSGLELTADEMQRHSDRWLYYLCVIKGNDKIDSCRY